VSKGIIVRDDIAQRNLELARAAVSEGGFGGPILDYDVEAFKAYRDGKTATLPSPYGDDPAMVSIFTGVDGKDVLCLAGGGGRQAAVFALLGANVTVFDLTPEQLERDRLSAKHYGYDVTLIQGDMRDLSDLPSDDYARVLQPISTLYVPDLQEVYRGVARVLQPSGLYFADYVYPLLKMPEEEDWDGDSYVLRYREPHARGRIFERDDVQNFTQGEFFGEFNHLLSDIINGQISAGLQIVGAWENPRPDSHRPLSEHTPGSVEHRHSILPFGLSVVSQLVA